MIEKKYLIGGGIALLLVVLFIRKQMSKTAAKAANNDAYLTVPSGVSFSPVSSGSGAGTQTGDSIPFPPMGDTNAPQAVDPMVALLTQLLAPAPAPTPAPAPAPGTSTSIYDRFIPTPVGQVWNSTGGAVGVRQSDAGGITIHATDGHTYTFEQVRDYATAKIAAGDIAQLRADQARTGIDDASLNAILRSTGYQLPPQ